MLSCLWPAGANAYILVIARTKATKQSRAGLQRDGLLRFARNDGLKLFSRQSANVLDDPGEIDPAAACGIECLVDLLCMLAERCCGACGCGRILRQRQVLH